MPDVSAITAAEETAEALLPRIFNEVGAIAARTERLRTTLRRTKALAVVAGAVELPTDVLTSYIDIANLLDPADITALYSWAPWYQFTTGTLDQRLGYFAVEGESTLHVTEAGTPYSPTTGPTVALLLTIPCIPAIPTIDAEVVVIAEISDMLITALAESLKLRMPATARR